MVMEAPRPRSSRTRRSSVSREPATLVPTRTENSTEILGAGCATRNLGTSFMPTRFQLSDGTVPLTSNVTKDWSGVTAFAVGPGSRTVW